MFCDPLPAGGVEVLAQEHLPAAALPAGPVAGVLGRPGQPGPGGRGTGLWQPPTYGGDVWPAGSLRPCSVCVVAPVHH